MLTRCFPAALLAIVLLPASAAAEAIPLSMHSLDGLVTALVPATPSMGGPAVPCQFATPAADPLLGAVSLQTVRGSDLIPRCLEDDQNAHGRYANPGKADQLQLTGGWRSAHARALAFGASSTWTASSTLRGPMVGPLGFSPPHTPGGPGFAQSAALERSVVFAGGSATVTAGENTSILFFGGVAGASDALQVRFGLRDSDGQGSLLIRLSGQDPIATPEPASMLLIGTGLAGLAAARRRRRAVKETT